jgi:hypothetical protein
MRSAIAVCVKVDEIAKIADMAVAAQAYYRQSLDVENEMECSRMRVQAERQLGVVLKRMSANGERAKPGEPKSQQMSRGATSETTLADLGIPRDRASRAMQLADVPQEQFDAAVAAPAVIEPRRILKECRESTKPAPLVPIDKTLSLWGKVRDLGLEIESGSVPPVELWRENLQPFQLDNFRRYVPQIIAYLSQVQGDLDEHP